MKNTDIPKINLLEKTASAQVLLYLFFNQEGVNRQELAKNVKAASDTLDSTLEYLKINNLVIEERIKGFRPERKFTLTELGLRVAQPLSLIHEALQSAVNSTDTSATQAP